MIVCILGIDLVNHLEPKHCRGISGAQAVLVRPWNHLFTYLEGKTSNDSEGKLLHEPRR